ncbi:hypothetical protein COLO4_11405 [Corchorus olitorius]|uniref:Uncharacterized protein n=1 Tax=Corchorus olitorius TaxID=93759 RepID=A0A1R3K4N8_9ROSI|nr:hypothetical protein COLO4_11405 [Corchorus olitorius]
MANPGVGNKFVSVNLNKSYGQQSSKHHYHSNHSGPYGSNRARPGVGGGGGGGMVVLSRPRSAQKSGPKLSVPPPLNLPSLRKEHERFDSLGPGGVPASGGIPGSGPRPGSSGMGWTKPGTVALQEKEGLVAGVDHVNDGVDQGLNNGEGVSRGSSGVYMPPSARAGVAGPTSSVSTSVQAFPPLEKASVLRGEDFPSLQAALPIVSGTEKKQKDGLNQKQKQSAIEELSDEHRDGSRLSSVIDMRPQLQSGRVSLGNRLNENGGEGHGLSSSSLLEQGRKQDEYFPGPLPLVRLNPRSDWADDERDTGLAFKDRGRDQGYSKSEAYWDRDFDMPRAGVLPHKPAHSLFDKWGQRDNETGRTPSSEVAKLDPYGRDAKTPSREGREGNAWRASSPLPKEGIGAQEIASDRNGIGARPSSMNRERENKYSPSPFRDKAQDDVGRRDVGYGHGGRQAWNNTIDSFSSRGPERNTRERYGNEQYNRYKGDAFQNSSLSKSSFSLGGKGLPVNDPILNFGREKRPLSKNEKPYLEDPFMKDFGTTGFDGRDPFPGNLVGVVKRKKDMLKQADFHDPVRESFEAELERVQKLQEQERQRIIEEQERALEQARREEEERVRLVREHEEQQRRLEEEAREAAWRAEQERLETLQRAEEQRIAREEEKRRIAMEEERRKQAAKQKLLELEERMAKRRAEASKGANDLSSGADENNSGMTKERDGSKAADLGDWEDGERMVERITTSASSDSSGLNRPFDTTSRTHFSNASSAFVDRKSEMQYNHATRVGSAMERVYDSGHQDDLGQHGVIDTRPENTENEVQKVDRNAARCDSQSSLSVSSPPDSPVHLSHDDLDESGDFTAEAGNDGNIDLTQEFDELHLEDKESPDMMDNLVLGFNEGVEVGMPSDEFERSSRNEDSTYAMTQVSVGSVEEKVPFDGMHGDRKALRSVDAPSHGSVDSSPRILRETEKAMQDLVIQPNTASQASPTSELMEHVDTTGSTGVLAEHTLPSSVSMASRSSSGGMPTAASVPNQAEAPVKLQFGLFSGPSLIPSPVPAIQIGSIQMPLHLHPQVGSSLTQMHPTQPPLFQFGQLRYTSPISQGVLPLAPQSVSFVQSNVPANFPLNQNPGVSLPVQPSQDTSVHNLLKNEVPSLIDNQSGLPRSLDLSHQSAMKEENSIPARKNVVTQQGHAEISNVGDSRSGSGFPAEDPGHLNLVRRNLKAVSSKQSEVKGSNTRSAFLPSEASHQESSGYQRRARRPRTEFRVRENSDKRQSTGMVSSNHSHHLGLDERSNANGRNNGFSTRNGVRKVVVVNKSKQTTESEHSSSAAGSSREIESGNRNEKGSGRESSMRSQTISQSGEGNLKRNMEEDVDAPLQSGVVRVFEQPGIEAPSDEDDFIEVRSKRQMLNDRREQREKEIKAKSRVAKAPRKPRSTPQSTSAAANSNRKFASTSEVVNNVRSDFVGNEGRNLTNSELSAGFGATIVSQPLAPIGTPAIKTDAQADTRTQAVKSLQTSSLPAASGGGPNLVSGFMFESKNKVLDNVQTSLSSWGNSRINQQVMTLTQTQLDDAMKPVQFDARTPIGDRTSSVTESSMPTSSILLKDKSFSSAASPINSLLAGEKIQFGAVTSPTVLPPGSRAVSHGIGPPGPSRSEIQISRNLSVAENDCTLFFEKEKHSNESCVHLEDCEAEAEAAASAVAVAAITNDEIVSNGMGTCTVSASDNKSFRADIDVMTKGDSDQQSASQSKAEESLSVSLPADLSVDNPPISLWPPLPSPQNSSSQMISHFPGGPPSHFPFYEMNPMLGGPIFAFGPHEESSSTQAQSQKSSTPASGPLGTWQQCHSGVDSFYGPPAGFTGHFITPPGGIPGVQGPPHMVVYNHFAPVGQFGLSFMGTTYIPSGKQPDWKHNPASSAMGVGEVDVNNLNMASSQRNSNMPAQIQHLAPGPGSPLLPMPSPLAMFDVSPFQSTPDMSAQARWSHVPAAPLQSVPPSMQLQQQQTEGVLPSQFSQGPPVDQSLTSNRFPESRTSTPSESSRKFPVATDATVTQLPEELGLVEPSAQHVGKSSSLTAVAGSGKTDVQNGVGIKSSGQSQSTSSAFKGQPSQQKNISSQHYNNSSGYNNHQRGGGVSQKNGSGEWSHRRMGFQGRNQTMGGDKNFPTSKMKQIYVAKQQTTNGTTGSQQ